MGARARTRFMATRAGTRVRARMRIRGARVRVTMGARATMMAGLGRGQG